MRQFLTRKLVSSTREGEAFATWTAPLARPTCSPRLATRWNRLQVDLMKSSISNRPVRLDAGNWKSLELFCGRPVHRGFSPNERADHRKVPKISNCQHRV